MESFASKTDQEIILKINNDTQETTFVHSEISKYLKVHQIDGIKFLFQNCYAQNSGCILAHCMGLGKTLQAIALLHAVINSKEFGTNKILVLCTVSTIMNWKDEIVRWLGHIQDEHRKLQIFELDPKESIDRKISSLQNWSQHDSESPAVCLIMGYESFRNLVNFHLLKANTKKFNSNRLRRIRECIRKFLLEAADIVICDEGHMIKNSTAATTLAVNQIRTKRRIILTGTPMQNHLMEYFSMVNFVRPNFLSSKQHFNEFFAEPIKSGQHADSSESEIKYMKQRSYALHKKLSKIVQRREISLLKDFLPEKFEFVLFIPLTQIQYDLYKYFLDNRGGMIEYKRLFGDYTCLRKIWTHLKVLDNAHQKSVAKKRRRMKNDDDDSNDDDADEEDASSGGLQMVDNDWWCKAIDKKQLELASSSHKIIILFEILNECKRVGDKCVIFSSFVESLNVVEFFMQQIDQRNGSAGLEKFVGPWRKNEDYFRLEGSTPKDRRHSMINSFNDVNNKRMIAFLISARAGGQGINLFGANRLILLDTSWNPSNDQQSIYRIYRMGQTKQCYIYRLLSMGTMEEKIYSRSVTKQAMSCRVIDKQQIDRHYSMSELYELYSLTKPDMKKRFPPPPSKDGLLVHLLRTYPSMIFKYIEHDSLLANKFEEELSDIEKHEAWQKFQEQSLQMQALNNMMANRGETVESLKLRDEALSELKLKERPVILIANRAPYSQYNVGNVSFDKEVTGSIAENPKKTEHESFKGKANCQMDVQPSPTLVAKIATPMELPNYDIPGKLPPLVKVETGCEEKAEDVADAKHSLIVKDDFQQSRPSSANYEMEYDEDKLSSPSDSQQMDLPQSYEIENGWDDLEEEGAESKLSPIVNNNLKSNVLLRQPSSTTYEMEHSEGRLQRSTSYEWLPNSNGVFIDSFDYSVPVLMSPFAKIATPTESSNIEGLLNEVKNGCDNDNIEDEADVLPIVKNGRESNVLLSRPTCEKEHPEDNGKRMDAHLSVDADSALDTPIIQSEPNDSSIRLSLNNDNMEGRVERSLSHFAKDFLRSLNDAYAASTQQQHSMEDYTTEERIIHTNQSNNLEYQITLKRPLDDLILQPIKRLKVSLEIDATAISTVDRITSTECQLERPQSLNTNDGDMNLNDENKIDSIQISSENEEVCPEATQQSTENKSETVSVESSFPVDNDTYRLSNLIENNHIVTSDSMNEDKLLVLMTKDEPSDPVTQDQTSLDSVTKFEPSALESVNVNEAPESSLYVEEPPNLMNEDGHSLSDSVNEDEPRDLASEDELSEPILNTVEPLAFHSSNVNEPSESAYAQEPSESMNEDEPSVSDSEFVGEPSEWSNVNYLSVSDDSAEDESLSDISEDTSQSASELYSMAGMLEQTSDTENLYKSLFIP
ncbi:Protein CHROMATIN REMODELING 20 [Pseudolycoriella hygida]|uniref:Protein CHROMATIN REMODELING 20 n=1 Tax=Pseudolycoriella hygida TaxID=35572 RepID=A0A9Q0MVQ8_9DIPT|nr:Protein CHROMATIN REMODELING 20 [Pseudolycoriella hygida]